MQDWQTSDVLQGLNSYVCDRSTGTRVSAAPTPVASYATQFAGASLANTCAFRTNRGLPMIAPSIAANADSNGAIRHLANFSDGTEGQDILIKADVGSPDKLQWQQIPQDVMQQTQTAMDPEFHEATSLNSSQSAYLSNSADGDMAFPPSPVVREMNNDISWGLYSSESPRIKQSSSQENSPIFQHLMHYPVDGNTGLGMHMPRSGTFETAYLPMTRDNGSYNASFGQQGISWTPGTSQHDVAGMAGWRQSINPWEQFNLMQPHDPRQPVRPLQQNSMNSRNTALTATARELVFDPAEQAANARTRRDPSRSAEEPQLREKENEILRKGKAQGLTYKQIRAMMGTNIAESTLRGRWRAISKNKEHRVRKPKWTHRDVSLNISFSVLSPDPNRFDF